MKWDAVVVGAGVNGLTAAARLVAAGRRVLVIEASETVGGSARSADLLVPGVRHDVGAAVLPLGIASPAFRSLGLPLRWAHSPVVFAHPLDGGHAVSVLADLELTAAALGSDAASYRRLVARFARHFDALAEDVLGPQFKLPRHPVLLARFGARATFPATRLERVLRTPAAQALLAGLAAHATVPANRALTGGVALLLLAASHAGGWPVAQGGTQHVPDSLAAFVRQHGGDIELGRTVRRMADLPRTAAALFDVTPRQLAALAPGVLPAYRRWRYGPGACKVDYVLSGPLPWTAPGCRAAATVHVGGTAAEILSAELEVAAGRMPLRPFVLVAQPQVADPTRAVRAPTGSERLPLWAYCHVPNGSDFDASPAIERQLDRFAPGWRDLIIAKRVLTARASEGFNPNLVGGDIAGGLLTIRQFLGGPRPGRSPYRTNLPGISICSSSCPPGAGVHGMAGWHAAGELLGRSLSTLGYR